MTFIASLESRNAAQSLSRWPRMPDGPLAAAIAASRSGHWQAAIDYWRDLLTLDWQADRARARIVEAALRTGRFGLADQMLTQLDETPSYLIPLIAEAQQIKLARAAYFAAPETGSDEARGETMLALRFFDRVLREEPDDIGLAIRALNGLGRHDRVVELAETAGLNPAAGPIALALKESKAADAGRAESLQHQVAAFVAQFPLAAAAEERELDWTRPSRRKSSQFSRIVGHKPATVERQVTAIAAEQGTPGLRTFGEKLIAQRLSAKALHWLIVALSEAGLNWDDPLMMAALAAFEEEELAPARRGIVDARLYRALGFPSFARTLLQQALHLALSARDRAMVRRRLASITVLRDRWADDTELLTDSDYPNPTDVAARQAVSGLRTRRALIRPEDWAGEPLETAFDWLIANGIAAQKYEPENRLLMIGNTLGCGGMERLLARSYRHFSDTGPFDSVDLALLNFTEGEASAFYAADAGIDRSTVLLLEKSERADMPFALLPGSWKARTQRLAEHIVETRPRVVHAWNDLTGLLAAFAGLTIGCPKIVIHFHHTPTEPLASRARQIASYPAVYRKLRQRPEIETVFCAKASAQDYAGWWPTAGEELSVLYNGFDWPVPAPDKVAAKEAIGISGNPPIVGTVMRFVAVKQPLHWARAAIALSKQLPQAHFLMVGEGPLRSEVRALFEAAGLGDKLQLVGQTDNVARYMAAMDLFWLTSASEGLPNVLIEAQMSGTPVAAFDVGGVAETFVDGETGALIAADDSEGLIANSVRLLGDKAWLAAAGNQAVIHAQEHFSSSRFFAGLSEIYAA